MKKAFGKLLICVPFLLILFGVGAGTLKLSAGELFAMATGDGELSVSSAESKLKDGLFAKDTFVTLNGLTQKLMNRHLVGNEQFYQDENDLMHLKRERQTSDRLVDSTAYLAKVLQERETPFLVCQTAERAGYGDEYSRQIDGPALEYVEPLKEALSDTDAIYFDYNSILEEGGFSGKDIFFKTDLHYTTQTEFYIMSRIVDVLEQKAGLRFCNKSVVQDLHSYEVESYPFWGNLVDSVGKIYAGTDEFVYYLPKFETSMTIENPSKSLVWSGTFDTVCMNGARNTEYRVLDFMQWPSPYYRITNHLVPENDILVIGCSMSMRTMAYLTLSCRSVTVLDPRYFYGVDYLKKALENEYDVAILFPSVNLREGIGGYSAQVQEFRVENRANGLFDLAVDVRNDGTTGWRREDGIRMCLWLGEQSGTMYADLPENVTVEPCQTYTFVFHRLSEATVDYDLSVQMLREGMFYFEQRIPVQENLLPERGTLDARILSHAVPERIQRGEKARLEVTVKNIGTSAWSESNQIRLCLWREGVDYGFRLNLPADTVILPGEEYTFIWPDFSIDEGRHARLGYQMVQEGVTYFGERTLAKVTVEDGKK